MTVIRIHQNASRSSNPSKPEPTAIVRLSNIALGTSPGDLLALFHSGGFDPYAIEVNLRMSDDPRSMIAYVDLPHSEGQRVVHWLNGLIWWGKQLKSDLLNE